MQLALMKLWTVNVNCGIVTLITLLPAGKTQLMEHDTPWRKVVFVRHAI